MSDSVLFSAVVTPRYRKQRRRMDAVTARSFTRFEAALLEGLSALIVTGDTTIYQRLVVKYRLKPIKGRNNVPRDMEASPCGKNTDIRVIWAVDYQRRLVYFIDIVGHKGL